jgi:hypothetical protein
MKNLIMKVSGGMFFFIFTTFIISTAYSEDSKKNTTKDAHLQKESDKLLFFDLPEAAQKTVESKTPRSNILEIIKLKKGDEVFYKVKLKSAGKENYFLVNENGTMLKNDHGNFVPKKDQEQKVKLYKKKDPI